VVSFLASRILQFKNEKKIVYSKSAKNNPIKKYFFLNPNRQFDLVVADFDFFLEKSSLNSTQMLVIELIVYISEHE
jgi:hypothetical protein